MAQPDMIASPTLARLYMSQGHWARARGMLEQLVERDHDGGDALALLARLGPGPGRLTIQRQGDEIRVRWGAVATAPTVYLVAVTARGLRVRSLRVGVTSVRCTQPFGELRFALPSAQGTAAASIGRVIPGRGYTPLVVASPLTW